MVAPAAGTVTVGGQAVDASNGFALAGYNGPVTLDEVGPATDRVTLNGSASFFTLNVSPAASTTAGNTAVTFQATILANFNESYTMTVEGPTGWQIEVDNSAAVTATPPLGAQPGDYSLRVVAQSATYPDLFVSTVHTVTVAASEGVALDVNNDPLITVPWGPAAANAAPGSTNNGQLQLPGAAFTIDITNTSSMPHTFDVSVSGLPAGWAILSGAAGQTATTLSLPAGGVGQLGLYISPTLPLPAAGTIYPFNVTATAVANPALSQSDGASFVVPAIAFNYLVVEPALLYAVPNSTTTFDAAVTNVGNVAGNFPLSLTLPADWVNLSTLENPVNVAAGATVTQPVTLGLPDATLGRSYPVIVESPAPGTAYVQVAVIEVAVVSPHSQSLYGLAEEMGELFPDDVSLPAALQALAVAITDLEASCASGTCALDLRDRVVDALLALATEVETLVAQGEAADTLHQIAADMATSTEAADLLAGTAAVGETVTALQVELEVVAQHNLQAWLSPGLVAILDDGGAPAEYTLRLTNHGRLATTAVMTLTAPAGATPSWTTMTTPLEPGEVISIPITMTSNVKGLDSFQVVVAAAESALIVRQVQAALNVVDAFVRVTQVWAEPPFVETGTSSTTLSVEIANVANVYRPALAQTSITAGGGSVVWSGAMPVEIVTGLPRVHSLGLVDTSGWAEGVYTITVELRDDANLLIPDGQGFGYLAVGQAVEAYHMVTPALVAPGNVTATTIITTQLRPEGPPQGYNPGSALFLAESSGQTGPMDGCQVWGGAWSGRPAYRPVADTLDGQHGLAPPASAAVTAPPFSPGSAPMAMAPTLQVTGIVRYEENNPALIFNPAWTRGTFNWASGGFASYHDANGSTVSLTFDGTWLGLGFATRTSAGLAEIFIDGQSRGVVDTYSRSDSTLSVYYDDLAPGSHTVTVTVLGSRNPNSTANWVRLDYIDVWDGSDMAQGTIEQDNTRIHRSTNWTQYSNAAASGGTYIRSGSNVWFPFTGDSVTFRAFAYSSAGQVEILIDGRWQGRFNLYNATDSSRTFSFNNLGAGPHVLQVQAYRGTATVDAFTTPGSPPFYQPPVPTGVIRYEEDHPALLYNGVPFTQTATTWVMVTSVGSGGYAAYSLTANDTVSLTFNNNWVGLGFRGVTNGGLAEIFIDGQSRGVVDTYSNSGGTVNRYYSDLAAGNHTVTVKVLGMHNPNSTANRVYLDYVDAWDGTLLADGTFEATTAYEANPRLHRSTN